MLGRGSFIESFPLFGFDLNQYEELFNEKLDLFAAVLTQQPVTWQGTHAAAAARTRASIPKTESGTLKTWIGVGGTPESVVRAARYGMPMMLAIIGGDPKRFAPFADLYRRALARDGQAGAAGRRAFARLSSARPTRRRARSCSADYKRMRDKIGAERGWPPLTRADFEREIEHGSLYVGSPETVARKIAATVEGARASPAST